MRVETEGFDELAYDLRHAGDKLDAELSKITRVAMAKMKKHAQSIVANHPHLPHLGRSFSYDVTAKAGVIVGEVGADLNRRQGPIDHLIENGTLRSAPIPHWAPAEDREVPIWRGYIEDAAAGVLDD